MRVLDRTRIKVRVVEKDRVRFRNRKGEISTNVIGVFTQDMLFVYVFPGWKGSAHDNGALRDALSWRNPLKVPQGNWNIYVTTAYVMLDMNCDGILAPFRGQRYYLSVWKIGFEYEAFSSKKCHRRCFGLLKMRRDIIRNTTWYHRKLYVGLFWHACSLVHNFI
ncbi:Protein translocase subunit SecA [Bienertia sinuspersici]